MKTFSKPKVGTFLFMYTAQNEQSTLHGNFKNKFFRQTSFIYLNVSFKYQCTPSYLIQIHEIFRWLPPKGWIFSYFFWYVTVSSCVEKVRCFEGESKDVFWTEISWSKARSDAVKVAFLGNFSSSVTFLYLLHILDRLHEKKWNKSRNSRNLRMVSCWTRQQAVCNSAKFKHLKFYTVSGDLYNGSFKIFKNSWLRAL